ncbi:uncharacterized protein PG998_001123 [Apiospora kogelbergensis]|uniref:uncharacterized protein n=1 Tax=Apiospora kogelbergensis TaxID=1337665 RepID=UPI00312F0F39
MLDQTSTSQRQRQRKFHRRSRNGCFVCKQKHIRCDERKPLCTYCLRHGGECGYTENPNLTPSCNGGNSHDGSQEPEEALSYLGLQDVTPKDPFAGTGIDMPYKSRSLFQLFMNTKFYYNTPVQRDQNSFVISVHRALSHPGFLHGALLMTTLQWAWTTGDGEQFRIPYLYHKLQAMRFVKEQLADPETAVNDGTVAAVASLALVENSLGTIDAVASHLQGLARIKEMRDRSGAPQTTGLLQRMILMAARCVSSRPIWDILDISRTDYIHQSMIVSLLRVALRPIYSIATLSGADDTAEPLSEMLGRSSPHPETNDSGAIASLRSVDCSRSGFIACYFYLYIILREERVDSFVLNWFIEQLIADVCRTEAMMQKGQYSQPLWFWTVMFGACAVSVGRVVSSLESEQMQAVKDVYMAKIVLANQVLGIKTWGGAKSVLRLFAWENGFDGEEEIKALWQEATWRADRSRSDVSCGGVKDLMGFNPIDPQLAKGIVAQLHLSTHETLLTSRPPKPPASRTQCLASRAMPAYRKCSTKGQRRALKHATSVTAGLRSPRWANGEENKPWRVLVDKQRSAVVSE